MKCVAWAAMPSTTGLMDRTEKQAAATAPARESNRSRAKKNIKDNRDEVDGQEPQMDAGGGLAEDGHEPGIGQVRARQFHIVGQAVRRDALQDQLARVGVFSLVALEGELGQTPADEHGESQRDCQNEPGKPIPYARRRFQRFHTGLFPAPILSRKGILENPGTDSRPTLARIFSRQSASPILAEMPASLNKTAGRVVVQFGGPGKK